jgi:hypothetical protein
MKEPDPYDPEISVNWGAAVLLLPFRERRMTKAIC